MQDYFKPRGPIKSSKPDAGKANIRSVPVFGVVKDNVDPVRMGRIQVYLLDLNGEDQDDADSWITVGQLPNFYGYTAPRASNKPDDFGTYERNPHSYGVWQSPPDIGTVVICMFVNGDTNFGYYVGSNINPDALHMVPAIGSSTNVVLSSAESSSYGGATTLPVTNINPNNPKSNNPDYFTMAKPVHSYIAARMNQQGIIRDPIRGPIGSSAQRESPSRVGWGVSTPGRPIYEGNYTDESVVQAALADKPDVKVVGRRGGHSIVMDDGDWVGNDQLIRIRTALGHQITMSDNGQTLMILHANGQSYIELGKEGTIDMYSTNSVNIRTQGDLNLHADNDININAAKKLNIQADSITVNSEKDYTLRVGGDSILQTIGKFTHKIGGAMSMAASGVASFASSAVTYINGSTINLNTGQTSVIPKDVPVLTNVAHTDTLYDKEKGFLAAPGKLISIVSRAPAHAPWASAGQGVNVPTTLNADAQLPAAPSPSTAAINATADANPSVPVSAAAAATVPATPPISPALGTGETKGLIAAVATNVASSAAAGAAAAGGGIVPTLQGNIPVVGKLGQTPQQLQNDGILKPGAAASAMANAQKPGATLEKVLPQSLFTKIPGAESVTAFASNITAQVQTAARGLGQGQSALTQAGVITGNESGTQIAGLTLAAATSGLAATVNAVTSAGAAVVKGLVSAGQNLVAGIKGALPSLPSPPSLPNIGATINSGNFAASLGASGGALGAISGFASKLGGGITGILDQAKGIAAGAFNSIKNALPKLKANVPQNLKAITAAKAAESAAASDSEAVVAEDGSVSNLRRNTETGELYDPAGKILATRAGGNNDIAKIAELKSGTLDAISALKRNLGEAPVANAENILAGKASVTNITGGVDSAVASGVDMIPGGQNAIASITNYSSKVINSIPGVGTVKSLLNNANTSAINGISLSNSISSAANSVTGALKGGLTGALGGAAGALKGALGGAAGALTGVLSGGLDKVKSLGLTTLAKLGLPTAALAKLNSAISGLSSGLVKVTTPQVGENTTDRAQIDSQTNALIGGAPPPNLTGTISEAATRSLNTAEEKNNKLNDVLKQIDDLIIERDKVESNFNLLQAQYRDLANTSPQGDPRVASARKTASDSLAEVESLNEKILALRKQQYALQGITRPINTGNPARDRIRELQGGTESALTALRRNL